MKTNFTAETFEPQHLRAVMGQTNYERGKRYYQEERVSLVSLEPDAAHFVVRGTRLYRVAFKLSGMSVTASCTCPRGSSGLACKHEVAAGLFLHDYLLEQGTSRWERIINAVFSNVHPPRGNSPYLLFFGLFYNAGVWKIYPLRLWEKDWPDALPEKDDPEFARHAFDVLSHDTGLQKKLARPYTNLSPKACSNWNENVVAIANAIIRSNQATSNYYYSYSYYSSNQDIGDFLSLLRSHHAPLFLYDNSESLQAVVEMLPEPARLSIQMEDNEQGDLFLHPVLEVSDIVFLLGAETFDLVSTKTPWVLADETYLFQLEEDVDPAMIEEMIPLDGVRIKAEEKERFLTDYLPALIQLAPVHHSKLRWLDVEDKAPTKRLHLIEEEGELLVSLRFGYGDYETRYQKKPDEITLVQDEHDPWLFARVHRQPDVEQAVYDTLSSTRTGLKRGGSGYDADIFRLRARVDPVDFLLRKVPVLLKDGFEIYGEEELKNVRVNRHRPTISLNVTSGIDWFDVQAVVKFGDIDVPLKEIRQALRRKEKFVKLADGSIGEIPEEWIDKYRHLFRLGEETEDGVRLADYHLTMIDQLLMEADHVEVDNAFRERLQRLQDFSGIEEKPLPTGFQGELRDYQRAGYNWLHFLHDYGFGGILADDMGLGKTVQVLVFLLSLRASGHAQAADLIVVPRSLLANWEREARRFVPDLRIYRHFGPGRVKDDAAFEGQDLIVTTYGTMRQDIAFLREYRFHYVVLDESQAIKNPLSQTAKAARLLNADHRLVMTGTPVENNAFELWSQFAFVNPGLLGGLEYFRQEFANPIERNGDEAAATFLRKMVFPFILRRTKDQVAKELPPRTEKVLYCEMAPAQRRFYQKTRDQYRAMLLGIVEEKGMNQARMKVLEGLLRLRQISNHPKLVKPKFRGDSAKMELLMQELELIREGGHKALVFSQFVQMLKLVRAELDKRKIPYVYLDGRTRKRQERVDVFQNDPDIPLFLISLKAGGVGLNLTAADYVIHIDPWWNPAVEMQATDRTHRIGQDKPVFVYKLIARDTVEEKILQLQERKRALVSQLISTESSFFKSLTKEDIEVLFS